MTDELAGGHQLEAVLEGGPQHLPEEYRSVRVAADDEKVKVAYAGGYEHFVRVEAAAGDGSPLVYHWATRTRIAE